MSPDSVHTTGFSFFFNAPRLASIWLCDPTELFSFPSIFQRLYIFQPQLYFLSCNSVERQNIWIIPGPVEEILLFIRLFCVTPSRDSLGWFWSLSFAWPAATPVFFRGKKKTGVKENGNCFTRVWKLKLQAGFSLILSKAPQTHRRQSEDPFRKNWAWSSFEAQMPEHKSSSNCALVLNQQFFQSWALPSILECGLPDLVGSLFWQGLIW